MFRAFAVWCTIIPVAVSAIMLPGWLFAPSFMASLPDFLSQKPTAVLGVLLLGVALFLQLRPSTGHADRRRVIARCCGLLAALIGAAGIVEYATNAVYRFHRLLAPGFSGEPAFLRIALMAAVNLVLLGMALVVIDRPIRRRWWPAQTLALLSGLISLFALLGYLIGVTAFYRVAYTNPITIHTTVLFILLAAGVLCSRPTDGMMRTFTSDGPGGTIMRRLLVPVLLFTLLIGWALAFVQQTRLLDNHLAVALATVIISVVFTSLVAHIAVTLQAADTERKRAEEEVRQFNRELEQRIHERTGEIEAASQYARTLLEASLDPLVTIGPDGSITDVNLATEEVTGVPRERLIGNAFADYFTEPGQARAGYQQVFSQGMVRDYPLVIRHLSGKTTDVLYNASVYRDAQGNVQGVFAAARDITERKKAEERLQAASQYTRTLIEASLDPLVTIGPDGTITDVNAATETVTGVTRERLIGTDFADYFTEPNKAREGYQLVFSRGLVLDYPLAIHHVSGRITDVLYNATVYRDAAGVVAGVFAAARDITERKKAEEAIERLNDDLRRRTVELEASNRELEAFSYSVSHDLRAPLRSIDGFSLALVEDYHAILDDQGQDFLHRIRAASQRMGQLIDDLLQLSRATRAQMRFVTIDLSELARSILDELHQRDPDRVVEASIAPGVKAEGDPDLLRIVLGNLLGNAWKFTGKLPVASIEFGVTTQKDETLYYIRDNGAGFDATYADKLFLPFQRLHAADEFPGTGIGLALTQRIIRRHGGRIRAEGLVDGGAAFYFTMKPAEVTANEQPDHSTD